MRRSPASQHLSFGLRLAGTLVLTTSLLGVAQYALAGRSLTDRVLAHDLDGHRADAEVLSSLHQPAAADPLAEVSSLLGHITSRPGVNAAVLVGPDGEVVLRGAAHSAGTGHSARTDHSAGDAMPMDALPMDAMPMDAAPADPMPMDATPEPLPQAETDIAAAVLASGGAQAVRLEAEARVTHAVAVSLGDERHVLVVDRSDAPLEAQVASVRSVLLLTLALGTVLALPLFYVAGGRGLAARHRRAVDAATRDGLTGLGNHRHFHEQLAEVVAQNSLTREPLCLALVDLDRFKQVNDGEGHRKGDEVLASVARVLHAAAPRSSYRVGGDEFALVLSGTLPEAVAKAERVRQEVSALLLGVTTSIGVAPFVPGSSVQPLWDAADAALYAAKRGGRNRVVADGAPSALAGI